MTDEVLDALEKRVEATERAEWLDAPVNRDEVVELIETLRACRQRAARWLDEAQRQWGTRWENLSR